MAFEWTSVREEIIIPEYDGTVDPIDPTELPPVTYRKKFTPPEPPKKDDGPIFDIVDDPDDSDEKKDEDFEEPDLDNLFDPDEYGADGDDLDPEFHPKPAKDRLEVYPHLDVCKDLKGKAMEDCSKKAIAQLIKTRMKVPSILFDIGEKQGVMMSFIVDKNGNISNVEVLQKTHPALAKEATRVLNDFPKLNPAVQNGHHVPLKMEVPIILRFTE